VSEPSEPRFLADVMLGTLAKWLRLLGYDTVYDNRISDDEIVRRCRDEKRIALTRDRRLVQRRLLRRSLLLDSNDLDRQIRQVLDSIGEAGPPPWRLTRCIECNLPLTDITTEEVQPLVPEYVFRTQRQFKQCPACARIYWSGTHRDRIQERLKKLFESDPSR
jgi:uncharacterized protein